jgi:hypothetical protein
MRTIIVKDRAFLYSVGRSYIIIKSLTKRFTVTCSEVTGIVDWERAIWKKYNHVKPSQIRDWIEANWGKFGV